MNDTLADAVFLELTLREAQLNRTGSRPVARGANRPARVRLAAVLLALATWLAPVEQPVSNRAQMSAA